MSSDSDVIEALTTYINDDPTARAWLDGKPDQWGMVVNPAYKGIALPVDQWPLLSTFEPTPGTRPTRTTACYNDPVPVPAPGGRPAGHAGGHQRGPPVRPAQLDDRVLPARSRLGGRREAGDQPTATGRPPLHDRHHPAGRQPALPAPGGVAGDDPRHVRRPDQRLAGGGDATCSHPTRRAGPGPSPTTSSSSRPGRPPTLGRWWSTPRSRRRGCRRPTPRTTGPSCSSRPTTGQTPGYGVGQLPPGYLPLTQADGLGVLASYTTAAAADVAAQNGQIPPMPSSPTAPSTGRRRRPRSCPASTRTASAGSRAGSSR